MKHLKVLYAFAQVVEDLLAFALRVDQIGNVAIDSDHADRASIRAADGLRDTAMVRMAPSSRWTLKSDANSRSPRSAAWTSALAYSISSGTRHRDYASTRR